MKLLLTEKISGQTHIVDVKDLVGIIAKLPNGWVNFYNDSGDSYSGDCYFKILPESNSLTVTECLEKMKGLLG